jgi:hypothetical protein
MILFFFNFFLSFIVLITILRREVFVVPGKFLIFCDEKFLQP